MRRTVRVGLLLLLLSMSGLTIPGQAGGVSYDIVYVRQPRYGNTMNTLWPEVWHPARLDPGADLMLLHPDGSEERLVAGGVGAVTDPFVSFDGQWVYYSYFYDVRPENLNYQREYLSQAGADIFRINLVTRHIQQLTFREFTPSTGTGLWDETNPLNPPAAYDRLGYGMVNLGPAPVAGGKVAFVSNRNGFMPPKGATSPTLQLFVMDADGANVTPIAPMNISSALHPTPLRDGRLMFSTHESQGVRDSRLWGIWAIYPDGRHWEPLISAFRDAQSFHFTTQLSDGDLVIVDYYNLNNNGFGELYRIPLNPPAGQPRFLSAFDENNLSRMRFTPRGLQRITPFTTGDDQAAPVGANGQRVGKFTHPSAAPNNRLLVVWTPGPANDLDRPTPLPRYDAGIYLMPAGNIANSPADLTLIKNDPNYNEAWPRAVVPYSAVHGMLEPIQLPWLPNDGTVHTALPAGTPYGLVGTSSFYKRESAPDYPPETVPGNAATLPAGASPNEADIDFTGTIIPPPNSGVPPLTFEEKQLIACWIDLGAPINTGEQWEQGDYGWFLDTQRPTLAVSLPRPGVNAAPLTMIRVGVADAYTGIDPTSLSITADMPLAGRAAGTELADMAQPTGDGIYTLAIGPLTHVARAHIYVAVADRQGNITRVARAFSVQAMQPSSADLVLTMTGPHQQSLGTNLVYSLLVTNNGPSAATDVTLSNTLPADVRFVSATPGCTEAAGIVTCELGAIPKGASLKHRLTVRPLAAGRLVNLARVRSPVSDANPKNNRVQVKTDVLPPAGASVALTR